MVFTSTSLNLSFESLNLKSYRDALISENYRLWLRFWLVCDDYWTLWAKITEFQSCYLKTQCGEEKSDFQRNLTRNLFLNWITFHRSWKLIAIKINNNIIIWNDQLFKTFPKLFQSVRFILRLWFQRFLLMICITSDIL